MILRDSVFPRADLRRLAFIRIQSPIFSLLIRLI